MQQSQLEKEVETLQLQITKQQEVMAGMMTNITFILAFIGLSPPHPATRVEGHDTHTGDPGDPEGDRKTATAKTSILDGAPGTGNNNQNQPEQVSQSQQRRVAKQSFNEVLKAAIQHDHSDRIRRAKSIVVTGLAPRDGCSDRQNVSNIIASDFNLTPNITFCKRLGEKRNGHTQPLLVAMSSAEDAQWLVTNAKWLRRSNNSTVREHVFINANRTKEEARAAYEQRCRRRSSTNTQARRRVDGVAAAASARDVDSTGTSHEPRKSAVDANCLSGRSEAAPCDQRPGTLGSVTAFSQPPSRAKGSSPPPASSLVKEAASAEVRLQWRVDPRDIYTQPAPHIAVVNTPPLCQPQLVDATSSVLNAAAEEFSITPNVSTLLTSSSQAGSCASRGNRT